MSYGRIRRGQMAGDQFTQINNALFRDPRLSAKAKGIFGFISTHRDGWGVTPESIAAAMKDGVSSIKAGLRELEAFGYLVRHQDRRPDGTMGPIVYLITDMPSSEPVDENLPPGVTCENSTQDDAGESFRRSEPVDGFPLADDPPAENDPHKKTIPHHTNGENTSRPSVPEQQAGEGKDGGTDGAAVPHQISRNEGVDLLLAIGAEKPEFLLTGKTLRDQGLTVTGMLAEGWTARQLRQVIAGRDLPSPIRTTVGAVVSSRLKAALSGPVPGCVPAEQGSGSADSPTPTPDPWTEDRALIRDWAGECEGNDRMCGRPTEAGQRLCRQCLNQTVNA